MPQFQNKTALVFSSLKLAIHVGACFVHKDLIPRVGSKKEAAKFPLIKSGPPRDGCDVMSEVLGIKKPDIDEETWFLIGNSRFQEMYDYLLNEYPKENPEVVIQDLR
ncbi:hypothetical protein KAU09_05415 [Candidatus Parcubacteria bacterium]|nr:hypothetical protein [Candidatus Parcubacteria bacterium]